MAETLDEATDKLLEARKSPSRKVNELDNRGSHFYLAMYWAEALANQEKDRTLRSAFEPVAKALKTNEENIVGELNSVQGKPIDIGGYYLPDEILAGKAMRPSETFNNIIEIL